MSNPCTDEIANFIAVPTTDQRLDEKVFSLIGTTDRSRPKVDNRLAGGVR